MLINSLLIFIEETLPIFVLYAYFCAWHEFFDEYRAPPAIDKRKGQSFFEKLLLLQQDHHVFYLSAIILGISLSAAAAHIRPWLGMTLDGVGYEVLLIVVSLCFVIAVLAGQITRNRLARKLLFSVSLFLLVLPHASDFNVFYTSIAQIQLHGSVYVGISIGLGICISISYILFFVFLNIDKSLPLTAAIALFLAGQLSNVVTILQQIDVLSSSLPLWNSNNLIADKNEYGQFFHVLIGYDATPTLVYLIVLGASAVGIFMLLRKTQLGASKSNAHEDIQ